LLAAVSKTLLLPENRQESSALPRPSGARATSPL
jgi:hypothetical protein